MDNLNIRMGQVKNLIMLALADGKASESELAMIAAVATREQLTQEQLNRLIDHPEEVHIHLPDDEPTRRKFLRDMVQLMVSDGEMHDNELTMCKIYAMRLGFPAIEVNRMVADLADEFLSRKA